MAIQTEKESKISMKNSHSIEIHWRYTNIKLTLWYNVSARYDRLSQSVLYTKCVQLKKSRLEFEVRKYTYTYTERLIRRHTIRSLARSFTERWERECEVKGEWVSERGKTWTNWAEWDGYIEMCSSQPYMCLRHGERVFYSGSQSQSQSNTHL